MAELTVALRGAADVLAVSRGISERPLESERFTAAERREFPNPVPFDRARLREWAASTSRIAVLPQAERKRALDGVVRLADEHPALADRHTFDIPFVAVVVRATRR